jgi:lysyl-tRNA synthetase class 2
VANALGPLLFLAWWGTAIYCLVIAIRKGKPTMGWLGFFLCTPLVWIAALRIARPSSAWAKKHYADNPHKMGLARERFGREAGWPREYDGWVTPST